MLYNNNGYTIEIPDSIYWDLSDEAFQEYIDTKFIEAFNISDNASLSRRSSDGELPIIEE